MINITVTFSIKSHHQHSTVM